jgi:hypothetical protein
MNERTTEAAVVVLATYLISVLNWNFRDVIKEDY